MGKAEKLNAMLGILLEHDSANKWNTKWLQLSSMDCIQYGYWITAVPVTSLAWIFEVRRQVAVLIVLQQFFYKSSMTFKH